MIASLVQLKKAPARTDNGMNDMSHDKLSFALEIAGTYIPVVYGMLDNQFAIDRVASIIIPTCSSTQDGIHRRIGAKS